MKYDTHGTWESNNYHGLGWSAKHNPQRLEERGKPRLWPTPVKHEDRAAKYTPETSFRHFDEGSHQVHLSQAVRDERMHPARGPGPRGTWPTPTCTQPKMPTETLRKRMQDGTHDGNTSVPLIEVLQRQTLAAHEAQQRKMYPTPIKSDATVSKNPVTLQKVENGEAFNQLARQVRREEMEAAGVWESNPAAVRGEGEATVGKRARVRLPTPTATNGLRNSGKGGPTDGSEHYPMSWQSPGHPEYGELSAEWTEWIMGWPIGWTSLAPMSRESFEQWFALMSADPQTGLPPWWYADPSDDPESGITKTVKPKDKADDEARQARIGCLGNGQVSAVVGSIVPHLALLDVPQPGEDHGDE